MTTVKKAVSCPGFTTVSNDGICFCGQECSNWDSEAPLYCSSKCSRDDALAALLASEGDSSVDMSDSDRSSLASTCCSDSKRQARILFLASQRPNSQLDIPPNEPQASVRLSQQSASHYRRMRTQRSNSRVSSRQQKRLTIQDESEDEKYGYEKRHSSRYARTSLLSTIQDEVDLGRGHLLRIQLAELEKEFRSSFVSLADSDDGTTDLPYEDPVGWERGGRIQSCNFLGLIS